MDNRHASERNQDPLGSQVHLDASWSYRGVTSCNTHNGNDEFADTHSSSANEKELSTPDSVNELDTENRHDGINDICYNSAVGRKLSREQD